MGIQFGKLWISVTTAKLYPNEDSLQSELLLSCLTRASLLDKAPGWSCPEGVSQILAGEAGGCYRWFGFPQVQEAPLPLPAQRASSAN